MLTPHHLDPDDDDDDSFLHLAPPSWHPNLLDDVSDSFANRWYDANGISLLTTRTLPSGLFALSSSLTMFFTGVSYKILGRMYSFTDVASTVVGR